MPINATFHGFVETTTDSLLLFEACRRGVLPKISRRLQERERGSIRSGTVFIFDEKESGIKRWTDGLIWSPSRILGNFLIYRELGGRESLNDNKTSLANSYPTNYYDKSNYYQQFDNNYSSHPQYHNSNNNQYDHYQQHTNDNHSQYAPSNSNNSYNDSQIFYQEQIQESIEEPNDLDMEERNKERNLVGSLTDTYKFRKGGLIKKTLSIQLNGCTQHMISYYTKEDVLKNRLATPSSVPAISSLQISPELLLKQSFRVPPSVEFAEMALKRPSLSPSSTSSSTTSSSAATMPNHPRKMSSTGNMAYSYHPYHQHQHYDDEVSGNSRRTLVSMESLSPSHSNPKLYPRRMVDSNDNTNIAVDLRRMSYQSLDDNASAVPNNSLPDINDTHHSVNNRSPNKNNNNDFRPLYDDTYVPTSQYQNITEKPYFEGNNNKWKIQRRHSNNHYYPNNHHSHNNHSVGNRRQNSCHLSSPLNFNNYQQKVHDIPTISSLPSPSFPEQQQQQQQPSPPVLSPSRFLWSANDDHLHNERTAFVAKSYSPINDHLKQQNFATLTNSTANNSLPRCFEGTSKLVLNGMSNSNAPFYSDNSAINQNNADSNLYFQQQQNHQQHQQLSSRYESVNLYNNKNYE